MSEMVERVARAIAENQHQGWLYDQEAVAMLDPERVAKARKFLREAARAAIEAMREPDHDMTGNVLRPGEDRTFLVELWQRMIDGALEQSKPSSALSPSGEK